MRALRSAPPVFGAAEAERAVREIYGLTVSARPLSGERDCNFHARSVQGEEYVLKFCGDVDTATHDCQVGVLRHLAEQDPTLPVPRLCTALDGSDLGWVAQGGGGVATLLTGYLHGQLLAEIDPDPVLLRQVGAAAARLDRGLRGFFHPALSQWIAWDVRHLPELCKYLPLVDVPTVRARVEQIGATTAKLLPSLRALRSQAIHGDCHGGNLLVDTGDVCGILDFGDMIHAPLILELAVAMAELPEGAGRDALAALLQGYARAQPLEPAEVAVLYDLVKARHATLLLLHAWRRRHDPAGSLLLEQGAAAAVAALDLLQSVGRDALTREWRDLAEGMDSRPVDHGRRRRLMGAGAELFYEQPLHLVRGEGVWLHDGEGAAYLDVYNNVAHVGHCHPSVVRAVREQVGVLATHTRYLHGRILDYAERLLERCPSHLDACLFVNSGSEANDVAWRMAQFATGRRGALVLAHAYHGITDAVAALTPGAGQPYDPRVVTLAPPPSELCLADDMDELSLEAVRRDVARAVETLAERGLEPAACFLDTAATSSGIYDPPPLWARTLTESLRGAGALIVADEVQYGLGRSGSHFWGFERRGLEPDLVTLGKPVGNGYPLGVVIARRELVEAFQARYGFFSTFGGNAVAAAAGLAVLDVIERERLMDNARDTGDYLRRGLQALSARSSGCLGAVRGAGLLLGVEVLAPPGAPAAARTRHIVNLLARAHVLIGSEGPAGDILKLRPPLVFRPEHADLLIGALSDAVDACSG